MDTSKNRASDYDEGYTVPMILETVTALQVGTEALVAVFMDVVMGNMTSKRESK